MAEPLKPSINRITQESTLSTLGEVQRHVQVSYTVGPHGPFVVRLPADKFTAAATQEAMKSNVDEINALLTTTAKS